MLSLYAESGMKPLSTFCGIKALNTCLCILVSPTHLKHDEAVLINGWDEDGVQQNEGFLERMHYLCTLSEIPTENIMPEIISQCPTWRMNNISYCDELFTIEKGNVSAAASQRMYENHKRMHRYTICVYTDGSKTRDKVAFAFWHQQTTVQRIQVHASVSTAELHAIFYSLNYIQNLSPSPVAIYLDSKSAIMAIIALNSSNPLVQLIRSRIESSDRQIGFCWVPSHIGVHGNELVDETARQAITQEEVVEVEILRSDLKSYY